VGQYYVKVTGKSGGTYMYVGESSTRTDTWESFAPTYFGGGREIASATLITIGAGTEARADMSLAREPAFKVRGTIANFTPHQTATFTLLQGGEQVSASRSTLNGTTGKFETDDVISGSYVLRVQQGQTRGEVPIAVNGGDVNDISVTLSPPVSLQISERILGSVPEQPNDSDEPRMGVPTCNISLHGSGPEQSLIGPAMPSNGSGGDQIIQNVFAGQYRVDVSCFGGYPLSIQSGGTDLFANPDITIQPGVAPPPIEISLKAGGGALIGHLEVDPRPANLGALIVPAFSRSTGAIPVPVGIGQQPFTWPYLAPGDYLVYLLLNPHQQEYREATFLQLLTGGVTVKIEDGKTSEVTLTSGAK